MAFIQGPRKATCFFCDYARERRDRRNHVLRRGRACFAVLNAYPYNYGHLMVAPFAHRAGMADLDREERAEMFDLLVEMQETLDRALRPQGYNVGINQGAAAGAGVPGHVHLHVVPRWNGDTNFMPVLGRTKVIPQSLAELYRRLQKARRPGR